MNATQGVKPAVAVLPDLEAKRAHAEWPFDVYLVPLDVLILDDYQRPPHHEFIAHGAANFDETLVGTIDIAERSKGKIYAILDGQQRFHMMRQVGKSACWAAVYTGMSLQDEAGFFYRKNKDRKSMNPYYSFRARRMAGDEEAGTITQIVEMEGFSLGPVSNDDTVIGAIRAVERAYQMPGGEIRDNCLQPTLALLREAFRGRKGSFNAWVIQGFGRFWQAYPDNEVNMERLILGLQEIGPAGLLASARDSAIGQPRTTKGGVSLPMMVAREAVKVHNRALGQVDRRERLDVKRLH